MLGLCFLTVTPCCVTSGRQARLRRRDAVLGQDVGDVLVGADLEVDVELHAAVAGVRRLHVDQAVDAVDLLLDRGRHRLLHRLGGGAGVGGGHADVGRRQERILLDRQPGDGDQPEHDGQDRDDDGDDRPPDEEVGHGLFPPGFRGRLRAAGDRALARCVRLRCGRAASAAVVGLTFDPGRAFWMPSTITRSPGFTPSRTMSRSPTALAGLDGAQRDHVVGADHQHALHALDLLDGPLRHQDGVLGRLDGRPHAAELAGAQQPVGVRELGDEVTGCRSSGPPPGRR